LERRAADGTGVVPRGKTPGQLLRASGCGVARMNGPSPGRGLGPSASETRLNQTPKLSFIEISFYARHCAKCFPGISFNSYIKR